MLESMNALVLLKVSEYFPELKPGVAVDCLYEREDGGPPERYSQFRLDLHHQFGFGDVTCHQQLCSRGWPWHTLLTCGTDKPLLTPMRIRCGPVWLDAA